MHPINILFPLWIISISTMVIAIMTIVIASRRRPKLPKCELSLDEFITLTNSIKPKIAYKSDHNNYSEYKFIHENILYSTFTDSNVEFADGIIVINSKFKE